MPLTHEERLAQQRAEAPDREVFLARFHDDGHFAQLVFSDGDTPSLRIICPHTQRMRQDKATLDAPDYDPGCDNLTCWLKEWYSDICWEAMSVATYPEDDPDAKWPQWVARSGTLRFLWRFEGYGEDAEFWFTLDDVEA